MNSSQNKQILIAPETNYYTNTMIKPLTKLQEKFREDYHNELIEPYSLRYRLTEMRAEDLISDDAQTEFIELLMREKETGVYLYPPPPVTHKNMHLHMIDPPSWEDEMDYYLD